MDNVQSHTSRKCEFMTQLQFATDVQGRNAYAPDVSELKYKVALTANVETHITVPGTAADKYIVAFAYTPGAEVWVDMSGANAVVPTANSLTACTDEMNPGQRTVLGGSNISMITSGTGAHVQVSVYAKPN